MSETEARDQREASESNVSNAGALYRDRVAYHPDRIALIHEEADEQVTYREFDDRVASAGNALSDLGVGRGDRVALCFPNELSHLYVLFGAMQIGAVPLPINIELSDTKLTYLVDDSGADVLVTSATPDVRDQSLRLADDVDGIETCAIVDDGFAVDSEVDADIQSFSALMERASSSLDVVPVEAGDPAVQPYTSGTTGRPKGVVIPHEGVTWSSDAMRKSCHFDENARGLVVAPLYHKNPMAGSVKPLLRAGGSVVVMREFDTERILQTIEKNEVTYFRGVPAIFKAIVQDHEGSNEYDLSSMEFVVCGSGNLSDSLAERCESLFGAPIAEGYGLTEAGVVANSPPWGPRKSESAGLSLPGCDTRIIDPETGEELPPGEEGELIIANPQLATYHNRPEANEESFVERDGKRFLRTGDYVRKDEQGYHYILGRLDDMLLVGGNNVYPIDVENILEDHEAVADAAVVGADHEMKGEAPVAFVVAEGITEDEIKQHALENGPNYAHPRRVFFKDALPLGGTSKVDKAALEEEASERIDGAL